MKIPISFFSVVTPCRPAGKYQHFRETHFFCLQHFSPEDGNRRFLRNDIYLEAHMALQARKTPPGEYCSNFL
jgi:hypothetical protein